LTESFSGSPDAVAEYLEGYLNRWNILGDDDVIDLGPGVG